MTGDRDKGIAALQVWYRQSGLQFKGTPFQDVVAGYDAAHPGWIETLGAMTRDAGSWTKVESAMQDVADAYPGQTPHYQEFGNALIDNVKGLGLEDLAAVARDTVQAVADVTKGAAMMYAAVIAVGILLFFWRAGGSLKSAGKA